MKSKAIISLILIAALVLSATIAIAADFVANPLSSVSTADGWIMLDGNLVPNAGGNGVKSTEASQSKYVHAVTTDASGAFTFESNFKVNNKSAEVHPGVSPGMTSGDISVGWNNASQQFFVVKNNNQVLAYLGGTLDPNAVYTAKITSTDGANFVCGVYNGGSLVGTTATVAGFKPTYAILWIENYGVANGPEIFSVDFKSTAAASPSPTVSPTVSPSPTTTPTTTKAALDLNSIREFYAKQPVVHMSNQSVVYNPDGTIKQVITGTGIPTPTTVAPTVKPNATNATATPTAPATISATAVPSVPVTPTKTQSPGFELVLAATGMLAALALITRKKK
jgi:hypothetical protein